MTWKPVWPFGFVLRGSQGGTTVVASSICTHGGGRDTRCSTTEKPSTQNVRDPETIIKTVICGRVRKVLNAARDQSNASSRMYTS